MACVAQVNNSRTVQAWFGAAHHAPVARFGKMQVKLLDKDYEVVVEEYDSFGESAFNLTLKEFGKKARK